jgi:cytochrome c oxidase subunit 2
MSKLLPSLAMLRSRWLGCPLALMLTSTWALAQDKRWGPGEPASDYGYRFTDMFWLITILTSVSFGVVVLLLVIPVLRHRERPGRRASFDHGTSLHDKRLTAFISVAIFIVLDAWVLVIAMTDLREAYWAFPDVEDPQTYRVEVLAQQWAWNFRTPGVDGEFGTADDILSINELVVPKDRPVSLNLTSKDVIHALFLPEMRLKRDVNPGSINRVWFKPIIAGDFTILCAELCGFAHYQMFGKLRVLEQDLFNQWEAEASRLASTAFDADDTEARWAWDWQE